MVPSNDRVPFSASALRAARVLAGMALADVGRRIGVSRQFIQQLEAGERWPSVDLVGNLAKVLSVEPEFFTFPVVELVDEPAVFFRCMRKTTQRDRERARVGVTVYRSLVSRLAKELRFPPVTVPTIPATTVEEVERAALRCREALGVGQDAPIRNMVRMVERAGVFTTDLHCAAPTINAFSVRVNPPVIVRSTVKGSTSQSRFDLAHELGHLVMHSRPTGERLQEDHANRFAGALLLPRVSFIKEFPRTYSRIWPELFHMKARWGASVSAIVVRAHQLGLIDEARYRLMFKYIGRAGWRSGPEKEEPAPEFPELVPLAFREIYRVRKVRPAQVLHELGWSESLFERVVGDGVAQEVFNIGAPPLLKMRGGSPSPAAATR